MHVHPEIAALRGDKSAQRRALSRMQAHLAAWFSETETLKLRDDMARYGGGARLEECSALSRMLTQNAEALDWVKSWQRRTIASLREEPLAEVPHIYRCSPGLSRMQLLRSGRATLSIVAYERRENAGRAAPVSVLFVDGECHELVISGSASGLVHRQIDKPHAGSSLKTTKRNWSVGDRIAIAGADQARQVTDVQGALLLLQLTRTAKAPQPSREIRLADGALVKVASGDKGASQRLMALAVLGALDYSAALGTMEERALDHGEDPDVRWEAVRQSLAQDGLRGMTLLARLRARDGDRLQRPAQDLERELFSANPALRAEAA